MLKKISASLASFFLFFFIFAKSVLALDLTEYFVLGKGGKAVSEVYDTPAKLINTIVSNLFVFAGIILFLMIFYAGFKYVQDSKKGPEDAKSILTVAIAGFIIMLAAYWIIQIVKILTGVDINL